jgi:UDP-glucose 4-epimerase
MKILVTGGAGFIGSHVVDQLVQRGHQLTVLDHFKSGRMSNLKQAIEISKKNKKPLKIIRGDISKSEVWKKMPAFDAFFHFAAQTSVTASVSQLPLDFSWNVKSVEHIIQWIRKRKIRFVMYANTAGALYGDASQIPTTEQSVLNPLSPYGATKSFLETYLRALSFSWKGSGDCDSNPSSSKYFSWASMRLANVYGPQQISKGEAGVIPIFTEKFLAQKTPSIFGSGRETRDYVHVGDVAAAFMSIFEKMQLQPIDDVFNVGATREVPTELIYKLVREELLNVLSKDNKKHSKVLSWLKKNSSPNFSPLRPGELKRSAVSVDKLKSFSNWSPKKSIEEGIKETVQYFVDHEI